MVTVVDLLENLRSLELLTLAASSMERTKNKFIELQRDQLMRGERADGRRIGKYRNPEYARMKNAMNPLPGLNNMDWKLTGALHRDIVVEVRGDWFDVRSLDPKYDFLVQNHGDPMGLQEENQGEYVEEALEPAFNEEVKNHFGI